jgi:NTP pyrophosphatase (non-canonical NTP hydrolase)
MPRNVIQLEDVDRALEVIKIKIIEKLGEKGPHSLASTHEILGVVTEEYDELVAAVRSNNRAAVMSECEDIAVGAIFGIMSQFVEGLDW